MFLYSAINVLWLVVGLVVLVCAFTWPRQKGKAIFIAFVATTFIAEPAIDLALALAFRSSASVFNAQPSVWANSLYSFSQYSQPILSIVSPVLLVIYALLRLRYVPVREVVQGLHRVRVGRELGNELGPRWKTELNSRDRVSVSRRREWAWMVDFSPILMWLGMFRINALPATEIANFLPMVQVLVGISIPAFVVYWVLKDCVGGVSVGKWVTGCRVVSLSNGIPIGPLQSMLRNMIFVVPVTALLELLVSSVRPDNRRLGDLLADTTVVMGPPAWIDGREVVEYPMENEIQSPVIPHPLDD
jgi:uncharacterized RDD family membrane protein YckC